MHACDWPRPPHRVLLASPKQWDELTHGFASPAHVTRTYNCGHEEVLSTHTKSPACQQQQTPLRLGNSGTETEHLF